MTVTPRVHDLLRLGAQQVVDLSDVAAAEGCGWVGEALRQAPWVVVRRARRDGGVPIGVRGPGRHQRWAGVLDGEPMALLRPDEIAVTGAPRPKLPPVLALALVRGRTTALLRAGRVAVGPGGSCAFELATGHPTMTGTSDLDLVVRADEPLAHDEVDVLARAVATCTLNAGCQVDALVETPHGAVHLTELARRPEAGMVLRTADGPRLTSSPWDLEEEDR